MNIVYLIDVLWVLICLGGGVFYGNRTAYGPMGGGVAGLLAAVCGIIIVHVLLGPVVGTGYRPLM